MSTIYTVCPKCSSIPSIEIQESYLDISIKCNCGYNTVTSIDNYLSLIHGKIKKLTTIANNCNTHNAIYTHYCSTCNLHLCNQCLFLHLAHNTVNLVNDISRKEIKKEIEKKYEEIVNKCDYYRDNFLEQLNISMKIINTAYDRTISLNKKVFSSL